MNVNGLLTKRWLSHLESNQNSGYQKPVCSRYTMGQAELRILYHISFAHRPVRMHLMRCGLLMLICLPTCGHGRGNRAPCAGRAICASFAPLGVYIYAVGGESCTTRLPLLRSARLMAPTVTALGTSGRVRRVESALGFATVPHGDAPAFFARHPRRDAVSPEYRLLASLAPVGAIREPHPRVSLRSALGHSPRFLITC